MANPFIHIELHTHNQPAARKFYSSLFDWKLTDTPVQGFGDYTMLDPNCGTNTAQGAGGGIMTAMSKDVPPHWLAYIDVSDVAASLEKAVQLGAKVLQPKTEIPNIGYFAVIQDPTGAAVGMYESAQR